MEDIERRMQEEVEKVDRWSRDFILTLNIREVN